jgi:hypothetical protein
MLELLYHTMSDQAIGFNRNDSGIFRFKLGQDNCPDQGCSWFPPNPSDECQHSFLKLAITALYPVFSNSLDEIIHA